MMHELEDDLRHESARIIRQVEEETRQDADRRARSILAAVMQRVASSHAVETTVSVVELKSDELKGRIIGREGRNIRVARDAHRDRLHHRRHARSGPAVRLRRGPPRDRAAHARTPAHRRPHPPGPHRGGLPPGEVGDRPARGRGGGAGGVRGERRLAAPRAREAARPTQVPHQLRAERAPPLDRVRPPGRDARRRAGCRPARGGPRRPAARHRQGRLTRDRRSARARRAASWRAATRSRRAWRTPWRRTTTRWSCRPWRP